MIKSLSKEVICPVVSGIAYSKEAVIKVAVPDGWYLIDIFKRNVISPVEIEHEQIDPNFYCYSMQGNFIPSNFDNALRHFGKTKVNPLLIKPLDDLRIAKVKVVRGMPFFVGSTEPPSVVNIAGELIQNARGNLNSFERGGMTPEMIYVLSSYGLHIVDKIRQDEEKSLPERIKKSLSAAGARLIEYIRLAKQSMIDVVWSLGDYRFISTIQEENLRVYDAGICISGADRKHSITSLAEVTRGIIQRRELVITRNQI